jgi:hypothetical protein
VLRKAAQAMTKVATGLNACPRFVAAAVDRFGGPCGFLPWLEDASVHHAKDVAVFGMMSLQRACLLEAVLSDFL